MRKFSKLKIVALVLLPASLFAETKLTPADQKAVDQTKQVLTDPTKRSDALNADPKAKELDDQLSAMLGPDSDKDKMYDLASQVLQKMADDTNGDPQKIQALIQNASQNPEAFANKLTPAQQGTIKDIATRAEQKKK